MQRLLSPLLRVLLLRRELLVSRRRVLPKLLWAGDRDDAALRRLQQAVGSARLPSGLPLRVERGRCEALPWMQRASVREREPPPLPWVGARGDAVPEFRLPESLLQPARGRAVERALLVPCRVRLEQPPVGGRVGDVVRGVQCAQLPVPEH